MAKLSKKRKQMAEKIEVDKNYSVEEAVSLITEFASEKFKESFDVSINLGVDPRKSDQVVRGSTTLPAGTGKEIKVAVFAQGKMLKRRKLPEQISLVRRFSRVNPRRQYGFRRGNRNARCNACCGKLGTILGPRGLMPNPKVGKVTPHIEGAVKNAKAGQVRFRTDKNGIVHGGIGKVGFDSTAVKSNLEALLIDLKKAKPSSAKGVYIKKVVLSSTMGPGLLIDQSSLTI
ncbi:MAG: 50S ribosomal protein L1 [Gammaproteobacteria bacterium]|nr:MAG: 50S ribosomal protein L1 [Gammaproteobacteria bacterium]